MAKAEWSKPGAASEPPTCVQGLKVSSHPCSFLRETYLQDASGCRLHIGSALAFVTVWLFHLPLCRSAFSIIIFKKCFISLSYFS